MSFENFIRTDPENVTEMNARILTLFQKNHPAHTTRKLIWKEFKSRIVPRNYEAIVRGESSRRVQIQRENLIPMSYVDTFYERFMAGILSLEDGVEIPAELINRKPFTISVIQKCLASHVDYKTARNLGRVNQSFKNFCSHFPHNITMMKLVSGWQTISLGLYDQKTKGWIQSEYVSQFGHSCNRTIDERRDAFRGQNFVTVFIKDLKFLVSELRGQPIEEFIFDLKEGTSGIYSNHLETINYQAILEQIRGRIPARGATFYVNEIKRDSADYIPIVMQYLSPECLKTLRFKPDPQQYPSYRYSGYNVRVEENFDVSGFAETDQWKAAKRLEWLPKERHLPDARHLTGFETVYTKNKNPEIFILHLTEAFLRVPPTNEFTLRFSLFNEMNLDLMASALEPLQGLREDWIFKFPIQDSRKNLVVKLEDNEITVTTAERNIIY